MKYLKTLAAASVLAMSGFAAQAGEINVGGVVWDPDWTDGGDPASEQDFIGRYNFTQWYSTVSDPLGSLGSATSAATIGDVLAAGGEKLARHETGRGAPDPVHRSRERRQAGSQGQDPHGHREGRRARHRQEHRRRGAGL